jgi:hypothetical protein
MYAAAHYDATFDDRRERKRYERADRREDKCGIERAGAAFITAACPMRAEPPRQLLCG